jgi:acyl-CoA dehydrogenase
VTAGNGTLKLENAPVAGANILGEVGGALKLGRKYQDARAARGAARKVGIACRLLEASSQYARDWKALGQPLAVRPSVQRDLAEMAGEIDAARWLVYHAAWQIDEGRDAAEHVRRAGLYASEMVRRAIDRTIAIHGGPTLETDLPMLRIYGAPVKPGITQRILELQRALIASNLIDNSP